MSFFQNVNEVNVIHQLDDLTNHSYSADLTDTETLTVGLIGAGSFRIGIRGTWEGNIIFEVTINEEDWIPAGITPFGQVDPTISLALTSTTTVNGNWLASAAAFKAVRVRAIGITGTATVSIEVNHSPVVVGAFLISDAVTSITNSTTTPLGPNEVFTGMAFDLLPFTVLAINIVSDQDSADGSMVQFSTDGITWDFEAKLFVKANRPQHLVYDRRGRYFRIVYVNGPIAQTVLKIQSFANRVTPSIPKQVLDQEIDRDRTSVLTNSVIAGRVFGSDPTRYVDAAVDEDGTFHVAAVAPIPGVSTSEKQDEQTAELTSIDSQLTSIKIDVDKIPTDPAREGGNLAAIKADLDEIKVDTDDISLHQTDGTQKTQVTNFPSTQPVSAASLPLPANAAQETGGHLASIDSKDFATQTTLSTVKTDLDEIALDTDNLALIKAKTDNLDVLLSTRTKPSDTQLVDGSAHIQPISAASLPLPTGASTEATLALIKAKTDNIDVALSTRTKPADQQHAIIDSSALPTGAATEASLTLIKAKTDNLDVPLSTRLKPSDTLAKVSVVDTITNPVNVVIIAPDGTTISKQVEPNTTQTGLNVWTPAAGKKIAITSMDILVSANILLTLWWSRTSAGDTVYTPGTDQVLFRGDVTNGGSYLFQFPFARIAEIADMPLRLTTSANGQVRITLYGYETT